MRVPSRQQDSVRRLARRAVAAAAPDELPMFDTTCQAYLARPRTARRSRESMLDFGLETVATVVSLAALPAATAVVQAVAEGFAESGGRRLGVRLRRALRRAWRWLLRRPPEPDPPARALTPAQLARVRDVAYRHATAAGLPEPTAALVADAIAGGLVDDDDGER